MTRYSLLEPDHIPLLIRQQAPERRDPGLVHDDRSAQPPFPFAILAGQNMPLTGFLPDELSRTSLMKPFAGPTV
jgi:hypothetical protein